MNLFPASLPVPALVDHQARKTADALAIVDERFCVTYGELESRSNALAAHLQGLGRDTVVGVSIGRSAAQIISVLAVMKAGAAFLPLDPEEPRERLLFKLRDARVDVILTTDNVAAQADVAGVRCVRLRDDGTYGRAAPRAVASSIEVQPHHLAYVTYTSGSTGTPKGVEVTHAGLANLAAWHRAAFQVGAADRASHISAIGFDAAVWEVWPYLTAGAAVYIASDPIAREAQALADWFTAHAITIAFVATPLAERMLELNYSPELALRVMLTGADVLHRYPPASLPFALYNNYGPTEATVVATSGRVEPADDIGDLPSIGRPIDNVEISILDENGVRQEPGIEGEICIAGVGVARGYRGRPDLTAEKFVWMAFGGAPPIRMYRTGDRGRVMSDGRIAFLGRIDDQVKIRGFRIEPREIEFAVNAYDAVLESAVVVRDFGAGDAQLVAYLVPKAARTLSMTDIQAFLAVRLPAYMMPARFVELPALPLTSYGKVDRAELRTRAIGPSTETEAYVAPRTATEERLAQIVAPLLKRDRVSVDGDFFKIGGHSLLGTQLIARVRDTFGVRMSLRFLFESPTIAALAAEIDRLSLERLGGGGNSLQRR